MGKTIEQILEELKSSTPPSSVSDLKGGQDVNDVFERLEISAAENSIAKQLYKNWEDGYRKIIHSSIADVAPTKTPGEIEDVLDLQLQADPNKPTEEAYNRLARQLREYYQRHEDDDDGPWWPPRR